MSLGAQNPWKVSQGHKIVWIYILIVKLNVLTIWLMFIALKISYTTKNYFIWKSSQERIRCHENSLGSVVAINAIRFPATGAQMLLILTQWNSQESSCFRRVAMAPTQTRLVWPSMGFAKGHPRIIQLCTRMNPTSGWAVMLQMSNESVSTRNYDLYLHSGMPLI